MSTPIDCFSNDTHSLCPEKGSFLVDLLEAESLFSANRPYQPLLRTQTSLTTVASFCLTVLAVLIHLCLFFETQHLRRFPTAHSIGLFSLLHVANLFIDRPEPSMLLSFLMMLYVWTFRLFESFRHPGPLADCGEPAPTPQDPVALRTVLRTANITPARVPPGHPHPKCGLARNEADNAVNELILRSGRRIYSVQLSTRDRSRNIPGSHHHYTPKDLAYPESADPVHPEATLKFINVDYYVRWEDYTWLGRPMLLYTFAPTAPAGNNTEYSWVTNPDNTVTMTVAGGCTYTHPLWDYSPDNAVTTYARVVTTWGVESIATPDANFRLVAITPLSSTPLAWYYPPRLTAPTIFLPRRLLTHVSPTLSNTTPTTVASVLGVTTESYAAIGAPSSVTISRDLATALRARHASKSLDIHSLNTLVSAAYPGDPGAASRMTALLYTVFPALPSTNPPHSPSTALIAYTATSEETLDTFSPSKPSARMISPPIYGYPRAPLRNLDNELWTLRDRLVAVRNTAPIPPEYTEYIGEFFDHLAETCVPLTFAEVAERQSRPTQRSGNLRAALAGSAIPKVVVKAFQKGELYPEAKDPRNISTLPREHSYSYSRYTLSVADLFKRQPWYGFGMDNATVAERVSTLCASARTVVETDFSRFDGTHSEAFYDLELLFLKRCFPHDTKEVTTLSNLQRRAPAVTTHGIPYSIGGSRLSGSSDTSLMNTFCNVLVSYIAARVAAVPPIAAYAGLGLYAGDDGLSVNIPATTITHVATRFGLRIKAFDRAANEPTTFLARYYPAPQTHPGSIADLRRQLPKLCASVDMNLHTPGSRLLANKAAGFEITDPETPIIAAWCRMIRRLFPAAFDSAVPEAFSATNGQYPPPHPA